MQRILAVLLTVTLAACGSASSAGPKTSNPPLKAAKKAPDPAEKPPVEMDGLTIKFNTLGFKLTLPSDAWQGKLMPQENGTLQIMLVRPDVPIVIFLRPVKSDQYDVKGIAESVHKDTADSLPAGATSALGQEPNGRWFFTAEVVNGDGSKIKGYLAVQEIGSGQKRFLITTAAMPVDVFDANVAEPKSILDSAAPL